MKKNTERNINLECMRILAMLMIILLHSIDHSSLLSELTIGTPLYYFEEFLYSMIQVCVNCFVLISGYFLITSEFKIKKLVFLWLEVVFYSLTIKIILMLLGEISFSITSLVSCFVPIITGRYWFITIYFGMYILSPYYNIAIKAMNKEQHKKMLIASAILFSGFVSIHPAFKGMNCGGGWGIAWFTVLYFTAAYVRLYYKKTGMKQRYLVMFLLPSLLITFGEYILNRFENIPLQSTIKAMILNLIKYDSITTYISSIAVLLIFLNINLSCGQKIKRIIIKFSASTFGVYLIHAHANICTVDFWEKLGIPVLMNQWYFVIWQVMSCCCIFVVCCFLDMARKRLLYLCKVEKIIDKIGRS